MVRIKKYLAVFITIAAVFSLAACAGNKELSPGNEVSLGKTTFSFDKDTYNYALFPEYHIVPGDVLDVLFQIRTWVKKAEFRLAIDNEISVKFIYNSELNETQLVRPDGSITLPYLGEVKVVGKTVQELTKELKKRYSSILKNPELYVIVPEFRSAIKELKKDLHTAPRGLSRLVTVRPDGYVTFPMVGDIFVANRTIPEVTKELNAKYKDILPDLNCDLFLERHAGSVIYVVGQVRKPGAYKIVKPISIAEAMSLAGSYLSSAKLDSIIVVRKHEDKLIATRVDLKAALAMKEGSDFFYLKPDDIVYVPKTWISKAAEVARDISDIIFFRGWSLGFSWQLHDAAPSSGY